jgi:hypothetical protein
MLPNAKVLSQPRASVTDEKWCVRMPSGVKTMSLRELDAAFQRGSIDARTEVWTRGMEAWTMLGQVANLEDGPPLESAPARQHHFNEQALLGFGTVMPPLRIENDNSIPPLNANDSLWASIMPAPKPLRARVTQQLGGYLSVRSASVVSALSQRVDQLAATVQGLQHKNQRRLFLGVVGGLALGLSLYWATGPGRSPRRDAAPVVAADTERAGATRVLGLQAQPKPRLSGAPEPVKVANGATAAAAVGTPAPAALDDPAPAVETAPPAAEPKRSARARAAKATRKKASLAKRSKKTGATRAASAGSARARLLSGL